MNDQSFKTQRRSIRLKDFDYSSAGTYFVTICTNIRGQSTFGEITAQGMQCNAAGQMVLEVWDSLPERFPIVLDEFVVMPDHVHGIIILQDLVGAGLATMPEGAFYGQEATMPEGAFYGQEAPSYKP
jgi:putative transposase